MLPDKLRAMRTGRARRPRLLTPVFLLVMLSLFAYFISVGILQPTLPRFVKGPLGEGNTDVGIVIGAFALSAVVLRPFSGRLSDRRGRRLLIISGGLIFALGTAAYVFVAAIPLLVALRLVSGLGEAFFYVGVASVVNDIAPEERRGEALSYFSLGLFGGLAVGPVIGELVLETFSFDAAWVVGALFALVAALIGIFVPDTRPQDAGQAVSQPLFHRAALEPGAVLAANIWGLATFASFVPLYALQLGLAGSRFVFAFHSAIILAIRFFGARIPDRLGPAKSARAALTLVAAGLTLVALWGSPTGLYVGTFFYSIGHALAFPALMTMAIRGAPASERGSVVGTFTAFFDGAFGVGAVSAGVVAAAFGYRGAFLAAGIVAGAGLGLLLMRARRRAQERAETEAPVAA